MKIWYQMGGTYRYGRFYADFGKRLEARVSEIVRPDTEVFITGLPKMDPILAESRFCEFYHNNQIINNAMQAEREGYDAFVIAFPMDGALKECREILKIPVVGIFQTACLTASMLGYRFTCVTGSAHLSERYRQMADAYGFGSRYLPNNYVFEMGGREGQYHDYDKAEYFREGFTAVGRKAIEDGASVLIPFSNGVLSQAYACGLTKSGIDGVPVLDSVACVLKAAEAMVDLQRMGVQVSRKTGVYRYINPEERQRIIDVYREGHCIWKPGTESGGESGAISSPA